MADDAYVLPPPERVLAVCAHPDDESFGLGGVIGALTTTGRHVELTTLTRGGASRLGGGADLPERRSEELEEAADVLGIADVRIADHADGRLAEVPHAVLRGQVMDHAITMEADALLAFDPNGITGHPDHQAATSAAMAVGADLGIPVYTWVLPRRVATRLTLEFDIPFQGRSEFDIDFVAQAQRDLQRAASAAHRSQSPSLPVVERRIDLLGEVEWMRRAYRELSLIA